MCVCVVVVVLVTGLVFAEEEGCVCVCVCCCCCSGDRGLVFAPVLSEYPGPEGWPSSAVTEDWRSEVGKGQGAGGGNCFPGGAST